MGMYTEIYVSTRLRAPLPGAIVQTIQYMIGAVDEMPESLPEHSLFSTNRWPIMLRCNSYYFVPRSVQLFEFDDVGDYWVLISRSDFKNYDNEVDLFFDWLMPYVDAEDGEMIGYHRYEERLLPTIVVKGERA